MVVLKTPPSSRLQFLRYEFALTAEHLSLEADATQSLSVAFITAIDCGGRWMSCTGGWVKPARALSTELVLGDQLSVMTTSLALPYSLHTAY